MTIPEKDSILVYYHDLESLNDADEPIRRHLAENKLQTKQQKPFFVILYHEFKDYLVNLIEDIYYEKQNFKPLFIVWFITALLVNIFFLSDAPFILTMIFPSIALYMGMMAIKLGQEKHTYTFIILLLVDFAFHTWGFVGGLRLSQIGILSAIFYGSFLAYEVILIYLVIKVEWSMRKVKMSHNFTPRSSIYEKPMIHDFELASRKNTVSTF